MPTASVVASRRLSDPLTAALQPPSDETEVQREARLASEREAKKISDNIDEQLRQEREALKTKAKSRQEIKVLLLGQSESGKSTTLKRTVFLFYYICDYDPFFFTLEFQLAYTPNAFRQERLSWRPVVYLNLVRSVRRILDALSPPELQQVYLDDDDDTASIRHRDSISEPNRPSTGISTTTNSVFSSPKYIALRGQLQPLAELEEQLVKRLSSGDEDEATHFASSPRMNTKTEVTINNRVNWKRALNKFTSRNNTGKSFVL